MSVLGYNWQQISHYLAVFPGSSYMFIRVAKYPTISLQLSPSIKNLGYAMPEVVLLFISNHKFV